MARQKVERGGKKVRASIAILILFVQNETSPNLNGAKMAEKKMADGPDPFNRWLVSASTY